MKGLELDWGKLHGDAKPRRMALPTYPFAPEKYWLAETARGLAAKPAPVPAGDAGRAPGVRPLPAMEVAPKPVAAGKVVRLVDLDEAASSSEARPAKPAITLADPFLEPWELEEPEPESVAEAASAEAASAEAAGAEAQLFEAEGDSEDQVALELTRSLAEALYLKPADIDEDRPFVDLGLDSVVGVEWVRRINKQYGIDMTATKVYEHPSVRSLARFLKAKLLPDRPKAPAPEKRVLAPVSPAKPSAPAERPKAPFLAQSLPANERRAQWIEAGEEYGFVLRRPAQGLDEVGFQSWRLPEPEPGEIAIRIMASALNFPDAMCVKGLYPTMPEYPFVPGFEVSGVVAKVGRAVTRFQPGDEVIAVTGKAMGGHAAAVNVPEANAVRKPGNVSFEDACSLPVVFITVQHAFEAAGLCAGESVLIHSATGGVGLMALQLAALRGAKPFATTSKPEKARLLEGLGVREVLDYRTDFDRRIRGLTGGRGVDAVLNTLSGDGIQKGLNCLAPSGRYLEIAVHALKTSPKLDLSALVQNQSFHSIDLRRLSNQGGADFSLPRLLDAMAGMLSDGRIVPLVTRVYPVHLLAEALEYVAQGRHIGKVVISRAAEAVSDRREACLDSLRAQARRASEALALSPSPTAVGAPPERSHRPDQAIAVIGMAGRFPRSGDLEAFWKNISEARDCVDEVPASRWDMDRYYQAGAPAPGKTVSKWMGVLEGHDLFDPLFFNISPAEAESMDPQQRLFLQACWHGIEDAGYDARKLSGSRCGVFVGCGAGDYNRAEAAEDLSAYGLMGGSPSILAARISYFLNLQGPCLSIETACSSSLVAIAEACDSLVSGGSELALAGGVYVMSGPAMHIMTSQSGMLSADGRCFAFDQRANGFVPGEGVGVVVLKRLADARRDGDNVLGVIRGWGVNQDGKTNGITAPNAESQARLQEEVYARFGIDPAGIQLVEAHGTGTKLGDPIEVEGLKTSFGKHTRNRGYCALGSVKSNIGHCMTAAGVSGFIKLLLALKHRQLPPTLHCENLNEHLDLEGSPFYVNTALRAWEAPASGVRQAAISSFGFSGTNAHLVIAECPSALPAEPSRRPAGSAQAVILSARTPERLKQKASDLLAFLQGAEPAIDLGMLAYTLQVGREAMEERLGLAVTSVAGLCEKLAAFLAGSDAADTYRGQARRRQEEVSLFGSDKDMLKVVERWMAEWKLPKLLSLWVKGLELDWARLHGNARMPRMDLPKYPFARERYWRGTAGSVGGGQAGAAWLHPLLHRNTSTLERQSYSSELSDQEFYLRDHRVSLDGKTRRKVLPAVACLEMARAAMERALPEAQEATWLELRDIEWLIPITAEGNCDVTLSLFAGEPARGGDSAGAADFEIGGAAGGESILHCQGRAAFIGGPRPARLDLAAIRDRMRRGPWESEAIYLAFARMGLHYGPGHKGLAAVHRGGDEVLARLRLPAGIGMAGYTLHPSLMDAALQASVGLLDDLENLPHRPPLPFALASVRIYSPCTEEMSVWIRRSPDGKGLDADLCDQDGNVCVGLRGFVSRTPSAPMPQSVGGSGFDESYYRNLIEDVLSEAVSIDEAIELG
ncbi:MAG TPA: beta-ketoacyl synthase N-terminal-like domain-containing protein [Fibrobacteria bacterium]|nr:beta-ketoacyl synthase N-terminal-like domain-containing protein [Fibrobacteria bacterium]